MQRVHDIGGRTIEDPTMLMLPNSDSGPDQNVNLLEIVSREG